MQDEVARCRLSKTQERLTFEDDISTNLRKVGFLRFEILLQWQV